MAGLLPAGWAEHADPGTGRTFFHNAATGETAWERPGAPAAAAGGALPEGWAEHFDAANNRAFFYKESTGETSWERPQASAAAAPAAAAAGALPEGWAEHLDPGSGRTFYYNAATGVTAWERPQAAAGAAAPENTHPAPSALPEGWTENMDPASGRYFYSNALTGETSWEKPVGVKGTWSTSQANDLGENPQPPLHILRQMTEVLSSKEGGAWSSVARVVDALNEGTLTITGGLCVIYSASKDSYWMLWRSDKEKEAERVLVAI